MATLSKKGHKLCAALRGFIDDEVSFVSTMLALTINQDNPDENYQEMLDYLKKHPNATFDDIRDKQDEILGVFIDDEDDEE